MAGSYYHCIDFRTGQLLSNERMVQRGALIENLGDAYEAIEEMYGMIWWLATQGVALGDSSFTPADLVELARQNCQDGLKLSKLFAEGKR